MATATLERPFGIDLMTPVGDVVNGLGVVASKTGYTTTYEYQPSPSMAKSQKKDDDNDDND